MFIVARVLSSSKKRICALDERLVRSDSDFIFNSSIVGVLCIGISMKSDFFYSSDFRTIPHGADERAPTRAALVLLRGTVGESPFVIKKASVCSPYGADERTRTFTP